MDTQKKETVKDRKVVEVMRLIDADRLGIGRAKREIFDNPAYADGWNAVIDIIKKAPTAYDPDKVVEALKKEVPKILGHEYGSSYKALKIIEIVKKGGI